MIPKYTIETFLIEFYEAKTRSQMWDFLYSTEYNGESIDLNETLAAMTDANLKGWFPKVCANYLAEKLKSREIV